VDYNLFDCKIEEKRAEFLYVGRLSEKKGFFDLLKSIKLLKNKGIRLRFHILGIAENEKTDSTIKTFIEEEGISDYLIFHGLKYGSEKYLLFKRCKYFIFPSHFENSPVVLKEAIASKMVIIASNIDANRNVLKDLGDCCLFKKGDSNDLANQIISISEDVERSKRMQREASQLKKYDKSVAKKKLLNLTKALIK
jgi:glycosyltransferase involved in cell wall biosynthesis